MTQSPLIHPTALIDDGAQIHESCRIGPGSIIGPEVTLGEGVELGARVILEGPVSVGENTRIAHGAMIGGLPQDFKFSPDDPSAGVRIGSGCWIKEMALIHRATNDHTPTSLGEGVFMMSQSHVGHDSQVADGAYITTLVALAGHVEVGEKAIVGGGTVVHQHCRIGRLAMVTGGTAVTKDVPPFCMMGQRDTMHGLNLVGLRRNGVSREHISGLRKAYRDCMHVIRPRAEIIECLREHAENCPPVAELADFYSTGKRPVIDGSGTPPSQFGRWLAAFGLVKPDDVNEPADG